MRIVVSQRVLVLLAAYAAVLFGMLVAAVPSSPFEWDEVLFMCALGQYDAAANSPHMPGYPLFVFLARASFLLIRDEALAVQVCSAFFAVLLGPAVWALARELGSTALQAATAAGVTQTSACFLWYAPVGLTDAPGATFAVWTAYLVLRIGRGGSVWLAVLTGVAAAASIGVRSQSLYVVFVLGSIFLVLCLSQKKFRELILAGMAFVVSSVVIWAPAVLVTGPDRWWKAFVWQLGWVQSERRHGLSIPYAKWNWILEGWIVSPFGSDLISVAFWVAVVAGAVAFWVKGRRGLVAFCFCAGLGSLLMSMWSLDLRNGSRYILSSLPFLAVLSTGLLSRDWAGSFRAVGGLWLAGLCVAGSLWALPIMYLRATEPAPVWEALTWIKENYSPEEVTVLYEPKLMPHVTWMLGREGYEVVQISSDGDQSGSEGRVSIRVESNPRDVPPNAVFFREWPADRVKTMVPGRYLRCSVLAH